MSTGGTQFAVAELLSVSRVLPNSRLISSCRRGITPQGSCRITALMSPLLCVGSNASCRAEPCSGSVAELRVLHDFSTPLFCEKLLERDIVSYAQSRGGRVFRGPLP